MQNPPALCIFNGAFHSKAHFSKWHCGFPGSGMKFTAELQVWPQTGLWDLRLGVSVTAWGYISFRKPQERRANAGSRADKAQAQGRQSGPLASRYSPRPSPLPQLQSGAPLPRTFPQKPKQRVTGELTCFLALRLWIMDVRVPHP